MMVSFEVFKNITYNKQHIFGEKIGLKKSFIILYIQNIETIYFLQQQVIFFLISSLLAVFFKFSDYILNVKYH